MGIKIVDLDSAFDKRVAEYFSKKKNKYTEEQWEDVVPELYKQFADTKIDGLGCTPNEYYARMSAEELSAVLHAHFRQNVPVDGFLRAALETEENKPVLAALLQGDNAEAAFAVEILGADKTLYGEYIKLLAREDAEGLRGEIIDILREDADSLCEELLKFYDQGVARDCIADILSYCLMPRDEVFSVLLREFINGEENTDTAAARLGRYGDERALPYIKERAAREDTGYLDWRAMRLAAETLGGSVAERDFSKDEEYLSLQREEARLQAEREKELTEEKKD